MSGTSAATSRINTPPSARHEGLVSWVAEMLGLCKPDNVHWCDGSDEEYNEMYSLLVEAGTFIKLNPERRPNSYLAFSNPSDVARVDDRNYICCTRKQDAGPTNNGMAPKEMKANWPRCSTAVCTGGPCT